MFLQGGLWRESKFDEVHPKTVKWGTKHHRWRRIEMFRKRNSLILLLIPILASLFLVFIPVYAEQTVKVWEEPLVIPAYRVGKPDLRVGKPDLNPIFYAGRAYQGAKGAVYPYPMLDKLTDIREKKTYRAVYLENEYIQICVLPEIGGDFRRSGVEFSSSSQGDRVYACGSHAHRKSGWKQDHLDRGGRDSPPHEMGDWVDSLSG